MYTIILFIIVCHMNKYKCDKIKTYTVDALEIISKKKNTTIHT